MTREEKMKIMERVDHTLLAPDATWEDIKTVCDEGMRYKTASVCIPPSFVLRAKKYVGDRLPICTVIGFPCGYSTTAVKVAEAAAAVADGADEIDMLADLAKILQAELTTDRKGDKAKCQLGNDRKPLHLCHRGKP